MKQIRSTLLIYVLFASFVSFGQSDTAAFKSNSNRLTSDSIYFINAKRMAEQMQLTDLSKGSDSLIIRVWASSYVPAIEMVLEFGYSKEGWYGLLYSMQTSFDFSTFHKNVLSYHKITVEPKSGWPALIEEIYKDQIDILTDMDIGNIMDCNDYGFELSTKSAYRFFYCRCPSTAFFINHERGFGEVIKMLYVLDEEFGIDIGFDG